MKDIDRLKKLNFWEKLGFMMINNPKRMIAIGIAFVLVLASIISSPYIIFYSKKHIAKGYLEKTDIQIQQIIAEHRETEEFLNTNKKLYKEYENYKQDLKKHNDKLKDLQDEFADYNRKYETNQIEDVLKAFSYYKDKSKTRELFSDKLNKHSENFKFLKNEIHEVYDIHNALIANEINFKNLENNKGTIIDTREGQLEQVKIKGKNKRVKDKTQRLFKDLNDKVDVFSTKYASIEKFDNSIEGKYNIQELRQKLNTQNAVLSLYNNVYSSISSFDEYWKELNEQYYTIVVRHFHERETDYITEPNPNYREWTETEEYQTTETRYKTETYTERVYVGSRIVGDTKEDIYETVTETRQVPYEVPVTKTRLVTKNNGEPKTIRVPYDVYKHYYTIEKHTPNGVTKDNVYVGEKHEKYDFSIKSWNYKKEEEVGYVVWKQLWNDNEGILRGKNLNPRIE